MMKHLHKIILFCFLIFSIFSCDSWMSSDEFFEEIDDEVFVANAEKINVYVRYAVTTQGTTVPSGSTTFKVDVPGDISCVTNTSFGFHHWAAFSNEFFNTQDQNKEIIFVSGEGGYNETILKNELGEDVITFGDKNSPSTTIQIHANRNDIVLVPIVAERPTIERLSPTLSQSGIVRNTSIRYLFTKKMNLDTFNTDNIKITSGYAVMGDQEVDSKDITEKFFWKNTTNGTYSPVKSTNGKMISFRLQPGDKLDANQQITINISSAVKDEDGYEMETDQRFYFTTGTSVDSLAPIIKELTFGVGDKFKTYDSIEKNGTEIYEDDAVKSLADSVFDEHISHRVRNNINIYLYALDLKGEGANVDASETNTEEDAVSAYIIRAKLLYDSTGAPSDKTIEPLQQAYTPGVNSIAVQSDPIKVGHAFTYDLSSLPDGLIAIDVWGMDNVGNTGITEPYYASYDNGYRTILVVKDTTPPVADISQIEARSGGAKLRWYNKSTLSSTTIGAISEIKDSGTERLASKSNDLQWIFKVGNGTAPGAGDADWKKITAGDYSFASIQATTEGAINIYMSLMDDLGNISTPVTIGDKVMYDNTLPVIGTLSWVDSTSGSAVSGVSTSGTFGDRQLVIPFIEALSGTVSIELKVAGTAVSNYAGYEVRYGSHSSAAITTSTSGNKLNLYTPSGADGFTSGSFYISGIQTGSVAPDSKSTVSATITDAAQNISTEKQTAIAYDTNAPTLGTISIAGISSIPLVTGGDWFFATNDVLRDGATLTLPITEKSSGIRTISFAGGSVKPSTNSNVKFVTTTKTETLTKGTHYSIDSNGNITFNDLSKISDDNPFTIVIDKCEFSRKRTIDASDSGLNTIKVSLTDFAGKPSGDVTSMSSNGKTFEKFYAIDIIPLKPTDFTLEDRMKTDAGVTETINATKGYTNSKIVNGAITINASEEQVVNGIKISGGQFPTIDKIKPSVTLSGLTVKSSTELTFNAITSDVTLTINDIELDGNATGVEKETKNVTITAISPANSASEGAAASIILDTVKPVTSGACSYTTGTNAYPRTVDNVTPTYGERIGGIPYFYTTGDERKFDFIDRNADASYKPVDANGYTVKISNTASTINDIYADDAATTKSTAIAIDIKSQTPSASLNPYSYIIYDAAGNCSDVKQFYIIKDTEAQTDIVIKDKITISEHNGAHFYKNNPIGSTVKYVMRNAEDGYRITIDLNGYSEKIPTTSESGIAAWAITNSVKPASVATTWNTNITDNKIVYTIKNINPNEILTLYIKDNCGNISETALDIVENGTGNLIYWEFDNDAPVATSYYPASTGSKTNPTTGTAETGDKFGRTYFLKSSLGDAGYHTKYFNENAYIGITYKQESCLVANGDERFSIETAISPYTVRARLYFTDGDVVMTDDDADIIASDSYTTSDTFVSKWYYFADSENTGDRTFFVPYPHREEGKNGYIYLLLEDTVGNRKVSQIQKNVPHFCYINTPPSIKTSSGSEYVSGSNPFSATASGRHFEGTHKGTSVIYVNGNESLAPSFDLSIEKSITLTPALNDEKYGWKFLYTSDGSITPTTASDINTSAETFSAKVSDSVIGIPEVSDTATAKDIYLYVRDFVGNWQKVQIGNKPFLKDSTPPTLNSTAWTTGTTYITDGNSTITQKDTSGTLEIMIAASTTDFQNKNNAHDDFTVYIPKSWFNDTGSRVKGLLNSNNASDLATGDTYKLTIPYSIYEENDGTHKGTFYVYDNVGNASEKAYKYETIVDSTPPQAGLSFSAASGKKLYVESGLTLNTEKTTATLASTNISHTTNNITLWSNNATVTLAVSATDTNGIATIKVNDAEKTVTESSGTYTASVDLTAGNHEVLVTDRAGNTTKLLFTLKFDSINPNLNFKKLYTTTLSEIDELYYHLNLGTPNTLYYNSNRNGTVYAVFESTDPSGVGVEYVDVDGSPLTKIDGVDLYYLDTQKEGTYTAYDKLGNKTEFKLKYNGIAWSPSITFKDLTDTTAVHKEGDTIYFNGNNTSRKGTLTFTVQESEHVSDGPGLYGGEDYYYYNGTSGSVSDDVVLGQKSNFKSSYTLTEANLTAGTHYFYAADNVGHVKETSLTFVDDSGESGKPTITIGATDVYGDKANCYTYDSANKKLYFNAGRSVAANKIATITINFTASDSGSKLPASPVTSTLGTPSGSDGTYTVTIGSSYIPTTETPVTITVTDNVGNTQTEIITLIPDGDAPTISIPATGGITATPASGVSDVGEGNGYHLDDTDFYYNSTKVTSVTFTPTADETVTYTFSGETGLTVTANAENTACTVTPVNNKALTITAKDIVGNQSTKTITFKLDDTGPTISIPATGVTVTPTSGVSDVGEGNGYHFASNTFYYNSTKIAKVTFTPAVTGGEDVTYTYSGDYTSATDIVPADGKTLTITAKDKVGNPSTPIEITFTKNDTNPTISISGVIATGGTSGNGFYLDGGTFYYNSTKVTSVTFSLSAGEAVTYTYSGDYSSASTITPEDGKKLIINAKDNVGNPSNEIEITFTEDNDGPTIESYGITATPKTGIASVGDGNGYYLSGETLYFNSDKVASVTFNPTVVDSETVTFTYTDDSATVILANNGTITITVKDILGNPTAKTITFKEANTNTAKISVDSVSGVGTSYPASTSDWTSGTNTFIKPDGSPKVTFNATTDVPACGLKDGIYKGSVSDTNKIAADGVDISSAVNLSLITVDNVGNISEATFTISITPDSDAPTITGASGGVLSIDSGSGWYELKDKDGNIQMALYDGVSISNEVTDSGIGSVSGSEFSYALAYGTEKGTAPATWTTYSSGDSISLPSDDAAASSYVWLWLKDALGNADAVKIAYGSGNKPIGQYKTPTTFDYNRASSENDLTISNYPISAGIKSIKVSATFTDGAGGNWYNYGFTDNINVVSNVLTFEKSGTTFYIDSSVTLAVWGDGNAPTSVSITDAAGYTITKTSGGAVSVTSPGGAGGSGSRIGRTPQTPVIGTDTHRGIADATPGIIQTVTNFFSRNDVSELPETKISNSDTPSEIKTDKAIKKSAKKKSKSSAKKYAKETGIESAGDSIKETVKETATETAKETLNKIEETVNAVEHTETPVASVSPVENISLAENEIIEYNSYSTSLVAIVIAVLAIVTFGIVLLLLKRKQTKI